MADREICKYHFSHQSEGCKFGDRCRNLHTASHLPCQHYAAGHCWSGDRCDFSHDFARQRDVCRYYNTPAGCNPPYGSSCRFSHGEDTAERQASAESSRSEAAHESHDPYGPQPEPEEAPHPDWHTGPSQSPYDDWEQAAEHWDEDHFAEREASDGSESTEAADEEQAEAAEHWDAEQYSYDQADPGTELVPGDGDAWAAQPDLSGHFAALSVAHSSPQQEGQWAADQPAAYGRRPPAGSPFCPQHFCSGACEAPHCQLLHGLYCQTCGCHCLHPEDEAAQRAHSQACQVRWEREVGRHLSAQMECCICLEVVMSKAPEERKFGLMGCDHCFCLGCIRNWRSQSGADLDTAVRTCPLCRSSTWFITPSTSWPCSPAAKEAIVDGYKIRLAGIDCKHFDFGHGRCPFGSSCFYRHSDEQGRPLATETRWFGDADGKVSSVRPVTLASFLERSNLLR